MRTFLVDNSVIQRLRHPTVREAWDHLLLEGEIATCLPTALEAGYSARNREDHARLLAFERRAKIVLLPAPEMFDLCLQLQEALFAVGRGRAVGVSDLQIAATALHHSTAAAPITIVHYDSDYDHLAQVWPALDARWIVPRGTVD
ncbi:PIN domain-containing protein [Propionibacteriaceae bacterium Y1923]